MAVHFFGTRHTPIPLFSSFSHHLVLCLVTNNKRKIGDYQLVEHFPAFESASIVLQCIYSSVLIRRWNFVSRSIETYKYDLYSEWNSMECTAIPHIHYTILPSSSSSSSSSPSSTCRSRSCCQVDITQHQKKNNIEWKEQEQSLFILCWKYFVCSAKFIFYWSTSAALSITMWNENADFVFTR